MQASPQGCNPLWQLIPWFFHQSLWDSAGEVAKHTTLASSAPASHTGLEHLDKFPPSLPQAWKTPDTIRPLEAQT